MTSELTRSTLTAAQNGDHEAVSAIVRVWHRPIRAFVATLLLRSQDADDVAQDVFLRALDRLHRVDSIEALGPFLKGVARNVIRERQRKFTRESQAYMRLVEERSEESARTEKATWLADPEVLTALRACLSNLPEQARQMLTMRYTDEWTSQQIGERVGMKADAVRTAMRRARVALLKCIKSTYGPAMEA